jgi:molecular chaperone Hsp33
MNEANESRRFLLEALDIRGVVVRLTTAWQSMQQGRDYPAPVRQLLGEMTAVTTILGSQLKQDGRITFQLRGQGAVQLLVIDCDNTLGELRLRGMARCDKAVGDAPVSALLGNGQLMMSLDLPESRQPFQSMVPLAGDSLAAIFEHYLEQSEQQPSRLFLTATAEGAAGLFLQTMPGSAKKDADGWNRIQRLAETVKPEELLNLSAEELLGRLFHEEDVRLFPSRPACHHCPEDWDKVRATLRSLGRQELEAILSEHGAVVLRDEICNREYRFSPEEVAALFDPKAGPTLH